MTLLLLIAALLVVFPLGVIFYNEYQLFVIKQRSLHDKILYRLCSVRDSAAFLAIKGVIHEESTAFRVFYASTASIIHTHKTTGPCFIDLVRDALNSKSSSGMQLAELNKELKDGPIELQLVANDFLKAIDAMIDNALPVIKVDRWIRKSKLKGVDNLRTSISTALPDTLPSQMQSGHFAVA